mgnify:CR=1 FL=1
MLAFILVIVGGLNWLLEAFGWGIGQFIPSGLATTIYVLVGLSALYLLATHKSACRTCGGSGTMPMGGAQ